MTGRLFRCFAMHLPRPSASSWVTTVLLLLTAPLSLLDAQNESAQAQPSPSETPMLVPVIPERAGRMLKMRQPVMPTFTGPRIEMELPKVSNLRYTEASGFTADLTVQGKAMSLAGFAAKVFPERFHDGYLYVNGEHLQGSRIKAGRLYSNHTKQIPSYTPFEATIASIALTEGNNVIEIVFRDPITGMEGSQTYAIQVTYSEDPAALAAPTVSELGPGRASEWNPVALVAQRRLEAPARKSTLLLRSDTAEQQLDLRHFSNGSGAYLTAGRGVSEPLHFLLLPAQQALSAERFQIVYDEVKAIQDFDGLSDREHFLIGLSLGWFAHGADVVTSTGDLFPGVVDLQVRNGGLVLNLIEIDESGAEQTLAVQLPPTFSEDAMTTGSVGDFAELMWQAASLYRSGDERKDEVALGLLLSDYSSFGSDIELNGWTSEFLIKTAEIIDELNQAVVKEKPMVHGFHIGSSLALASQIDLPRPGYPASGEVWSRPLISEVLSYYVETIEPYLAAEQEAAPSPKQRRAPTVTTPPDAVPEKYRALWPFIGWFYETGNSLDSDAEPGLGSFIPESLKHPLIPPVMAIIAVIALFGGSIWMLVVQFKTSPGWGFGQLGANLTSCLLVIPGLIATLVFCALHWQVARRPFALQVAALLLGGISLLFTPEWAGRIGE